MPCIMLSEVSAVSVIGGIIQCHPKYIVNAPGGGFNEALELIT